jgi:alpha-tubulin suppressor-like RCC1 family protein
MTRVGSRVRASHPRVARHARRLRRGVWAGTAVATAAVLVALSAVLPAQQAAAGRGAHGGRPAVAAAAAAGAVSWGDNSAGELGNGTLTGSDVPGRVSGLSGVRAVAAGGRHELAVLSGGTVVAWGDDTFGQLGNGIASANGDTEVPAAVPGLSGVTAVAAGEEHSLALLSDGTVMAWGENRYGQLGSGSTAGSAVPVPVKGLTGVKAIAAGALFSLALLNNGTVMSWGRNDVGQLGNGKQGDSSAPVPVKGLTGVTAIAGGGQHALALLSDGTVMSWGDNSNDQLGDGRDVSTQSLSTVPVPVVKITGVRAVAAGSEHSLALLSNGTVEAWGDNGFFELARPNGFPGGIADSDVPLKIPGVAGATAIAAGGLFSLALIAGGTVKSWGDNALGQLGNAATVTGPSVATVTGLSGATAVAAGSLQSIALGATSAAAGTAGSGPVSSPWRVTPNPPDPGASGLKDVTFEGVSASSAAQAWAVGASQALANSQPLAEHWDGRAWHSAAVPLPAGAATGQLGGVLELAPANAWAVGAINTQSGTGERTLIEHWDGTRWSVIPSPNPRTGAGTTDVLSAIAGTSASDLWAVGFFGTDIFNALLFEHWNGKAWSFVRPPTIRGDMFGEAVTAVTPTDAWAVGDTAGGTISAHWNGHAWALVPTPTLNDGSAPQNFLTGVTAPAANNVWASGYEGNASQQNFAVPYVLHWNGTAWSLIKVPNAGTEGSQLRGITARSATDIWAAGETLEDDGSLLSLTEHFNGTSWSLVPSLDPGDLPPLVDSTFSAVASAPPRTLFAVGTQELPVGCCLLALAERTTRG